MPLSRNMDKRIAELEAENANLQEDYDNLGWLIATTPGLNKRASYEALKVRNAALEAGLDDWLRVLNSLAGLKVPVVIYERLMTMLEQAQELKEGRDD